MLESLKKTHQNKTKLHTRRFHRSHFSVLIPLFTALNFAQSPFFLLLFHHYNPLFLSLFFFFNFIFPSPINILSLLSSSFTLHSQYLLCFFISFFLFPQETNLLLLNIMATAPSCRSVVIVLSLLLLVTFSQVAEV